MCVVCMSVHHLCVGVLGAPKLGLQTVMDSGWGFWEPNSASPRFLCNGFCSTSSECVHSLPLFRCECCDTHGKVFLLPSLLNPGPLETLQMAAPCLKLQLRAGECSVGSAYRTHIKTRVQAPSTHVNARWAWQAPYSSSILHSRGQGTPEKLATQTSQISELQVQ